MTNKEKIYALGLFIIVFLLRFPLAFITNQFLFYDGGNFAFAMDDFNINEYRPHLPGYWLHIQIANFVNLIFDNPNLSLKFLSAFYSALSSVMLFGAFKKYSDNPNFNFILSLFFFVNPVIWFWWLTAETYAFSILLGLSVFYLGESGRYYFILPILAITAGIRLTDSILMLPLALFYLINSKNYKKIFFSFLLALVISFAWLYPTISSVGGISEYFSLFKTHSPLPDYLNTTRLNSFLINSSNFVFYNYLFFVPIGFLFLINYKRLWQSDFKNRFFLWVLPSILTYLLLHYNKGYILLIASPFLIYLSSTIKNQRLFSSLVSFFNMLFIAFFITFPFGKKVFVEEETETKIDKSLTEFIFEKTNYFYNLSLNRFIKVEYDYQQFVSLKPGHFLTKYDKEYLLITEVFPLNVRSLNYYHQNLKFANMIKNEDNYYVHTKNTISKKENVEGMVRNSLFLVKGEMYDKFFKKNTRLIARSRDFAILLPIDSEIQNILKILNLQTTI